MIIRVFEARCLRLEGEDRRGIRGNIPSSFDIIEVLKDTKVCTCLCCGTRSSGVSNIPESGTPFDPSFHGVYAASGTRNIESVQGKG
jgi:hypothetical protein